jgi:hypothetical protein
MVQKELPCRGFEVPEIEADPHEQLGWPVSSPETGLAAIQPLGVP